MNHGIGDGLDDILENVETFFVVFWQQFVFLSLVFLIILAFSCLVPKIVASILRRARVRPWGVNLVRYAVHAGLIFLSVYAVFRSLGASVNTIVLTAGVALISNGLVQLIGNAVAGVALQFDETLQPGRDIEFERTRGLIVDTDLRRVHLLLPPEKPGEPSRNMYIANTLFFGGRYISDTYTAGVFEHAPVAFVTQSAFASGERKRQPSKFQAPF